MLSIKTKPSARDFNFEEQSHTQSTGKPSPNPRCTELSYSLQRNSAWSQFFPCSTLNTSELSWVTPHFFRLQLQCEPLGHPS